MKTIGTLTITDFRLIAAKYYIRVSSIEIFNKEIKHVMSEADVLAMLSPEAGFFCGTARSRFRCRSFFS
ncbi:hypothetical protein M422DRAFT_179881 [Sphaerobolus stellatus SS14]|uniref:SEC63 domain-containing protein n=1 Tax=Sphaerobolus stellatus (strain SS14) TaxID=990650 RepID=A0A0C9U046_SPHS4|nr:hypothetical protein M422DRAFT_179881 [Sphaerobolus stellatus SS14]